MSLFFQYPNRSFFVREIARQIEAQINSVRRELANLEAAGIIGPVSVLEKINSDLDNAGTVRSKYYRLKVDCGAFSELKSLLSKEYAMKEQALVDQLKQKAGTIKLFLLTGVFSGAEAETDILLVGDLKPLVVSKLIAEYEKKLGKTIKYTMLSEAEFRDRRDLGDKFLYSVFEGKHTPVIDEITGTK